MHGPVLEFALTLSVLVMLLAGMLPARLASRVELAGTIQQGSRTIASGGVMRNELVLAQIAVTLMLVFAGASFFQRGVGSVGIPESDLRRLDGLAENQPP